MRRKNYNNKLETSDIALSHAENQNVLCPAHFFLFFAKLRCTRMHTNKVPIAAHSFALCVHVSLRVL